MPLKQPSQKSQYRLVDLWNSKYPAGTPVKVRLDDDSVVAAKTAGPAWVLGGHTAVVRLEDGVKSPAYMLTRCTPL